MARRTKTREFVNRDRNGTCIYVGTFIHFSFFWYTPSGEVERDRQGRIIKKDGHICFRYKLNGKFVTNRLTALNYSGDDWEYCREFSYHDNIENPTIWSCYVP